MWVVLDTATFYFYLIIAFCVGTLIGYLVARDQRSRQA